MVYILIPWKICDFFSILVFCVIYFIVYYFYFVDSSSEEIENAREGIYWLLRASEQGHIEATNLLQNCLETGKGLIILKLFFL